MPKESINQSVERVTRARGRPAAWLAWMIWMTIVVFGATLLDLYDAYWYRHVLTHYWDRPADIGEVLQSGILILAVPAYATVGAVVVSLRPKNAVGWLCLFFSILLLVGNWQPTEVALLDLRDVLQNLAWSLLFPPLPVTLMLLIFPGGRLVSRHWWAVVGIASTGAILSTFAIFLPAHPSAGFARAIGVSASLVALLASVVVVLRWGRRRGWERQQIKLLAYTVALTVVAVIAAVASSYLWEDIPGAQSYPTVLALVVSFAGLTLGLPVAIGIAILKHNLYDVDLVFNRTLVYGALAATLALIYVGAVVTLQYVLGPLVVGGSQFAVVASTLIVAALFNPLRRGIQSFIDRRFYRRKYDARKTLATFARLREETDLEALNEDLVGVVRDDATGPCGPVAQRAAAQT